MSQMLPDFSLHGEEGNNPNREQGLTDKERKGLLNALLDGNEKFHVLYRMYKFNVA
jgi:hypothetical protein